MGMFPYTCGYCGGAYERCGVNKDCEGGQFCWEDDVIILVNGKRFEGVYDGYGQVETLDHEIYIPSEFNEFIEEWDLNLTYDPEETQVDIYCRSCYNNE